MQQLAGWTRGLRGKLFILAVIPVLVLCAISFVAKRSIDSLSSDLVDAGEMRAPKIRALGEMDSARNAIFRWLWVVHHVDESDSAGRKKFLERAQSEIDRFDTALKAYQGYARHETEIKLIGQIDDGWKKLHPFVLDAMAALNKCTKADTRRAETIITGDMRDVADGMRGVFADLRGFTENQIKDGIVATKKEVQQISAFMAAFSIAAALGLLVISFFVATRLANGLGKIASQIGEAGTQVSSASTQLSSSSTQLSAGATEAAESLEETVSSLEELASMVKLNADHAREASGLSQTSRQSAEQGELEIKALIQAMGEISGSSKKIEEIINVIDDIAFQTNILALNAAVEAARAGDQGKGFAVVAEAVRSLAQRSGAAAKEITTLIKDSSEKVGRGSEMATRSGTVLTAIVGSIRKVSDLNNEIATASREQSLGLEQISKAMSQLDQATQGNAAASEQVAAAAEEMSAQSGLLKDQVGHLIEIIEGGGAKSGAISLGDSESLAAATVPSERTRASVATGAKSGARVYSLNDRKKGQLVPLNGSGQRPPMSKEEVERLFPMEEDSPKAKTSGDA